MINNDHFRSTDKISLRDLRRGEVCDGTHEDQLPPDGLDVADPDVMFCLDLMRRSWSSGPDTRDQDTHRPSPESTATGSLGDAINLATSWGRFVLHHRLGQGTYGVVFAACDTLLKREVAVKIPQPHVLTNAGSLKRFLREAEAAATLEHSGIVRVYEVGEIGGVAFIVSELCDGPNLAQWLAADRPPLPAKTAAAIVAQIAGALNHAHSRGVLHRDLKPSNILLGKTDMGQGDFPFTARISDFGLAKLAGAESIGTIDGALVGTFRYMSPEQAAGRASDVGVQADVWALGAILYELLAGKPPFDTDDVSVLRQIQEDEPVHLAALNREIPADLVNVCHCALQKDLADRYSSAAKLLADLQRFARGEPVSARTLGICPRVTRWMRRRPLVASLAAALLLVGCTGLLGVITQWRRADREAVTAREEAARAETHLAQAQASLRDLACMVQELGLHSHPDDHHLRDVARIIALQLERIEQDSLDAEARWASIAASRMFCANMSALAGDHPGALLNFEPGVAAWRQIVEEEPANHGYRRALALALYCYGDSLDACGQEVAANDKFEAAREALLPPGNDLRAITAGLLEYTEMISNLGRSFDLRRRSKQAEAAFSEAALVAQRTHALDRSSESISLCAASMTAQYAKHLVRTHERRRGMSEYEKARDLAEEVLASHAAHEPAEDLTVHIDLARAQLFRRARDWFNASRAYTEAIQRSERGLERYSNKPAWRARLANLCYEFGLSKLERKEPGAEFVLEKASAHWKILSSKDQISDADTAKWGVILCELAGIYQGKDQSGKAAEAAEQAAGLLAATHRLVPATPKIHRARETSAAMLAAMRGKSVNVQPTTDLDSDEELDELE